MKYIDLNTQDFCKRGKSVKRLLSTPKKTSQKMNLKSNHYIFLFCRQIKEQKSRKYILQCQNQKYILLEKLLTNETKNELPNIDDHFISSNICNEFFTNIKENFSSGVIGEIEMARRGQSVKSLQFSFGKSIITVSKSHEVMRSMKKVVSGGGGVLNL